MTFTRLLILLMMLMMISCSNDDSPITPEGKEIQIGGLFTLSGNLESLGKDSKAAMELAVEDINQYFIDSGIPYKVKANFEDTELNPDKAKEKFNKLLNNGCEIFIGPSASSEVAAVKPIADANDAIVISHYSTAGSLAIAGDNIFRFCPSDKLQSPAIMRLMKLDGKNTIITVWRDDAGNDGLVQSVLNNKQLLGFEVVEGSKYNSTTTDFTQTISKLSSEVENALKSKNAKEVCIYVAAFDEIIQLFEQIPQNSVLYQVNWYGSDGIALNLQLLNNIKASKFADAVNLVCPNLGLSESAKLIWQPLTTKIKQKTGNNTFNPYSVAVYDACWVAIKSYVSANNKNIENLKNAIKAEASQYFGATGRTVLDVNGDRQIGDFWFYEIQNTDTKSEWVKTATFDGNTNLVIKN